MTPSEYITVAAHTAWDVTDVNGQRLTIRCPTTLDRLRLFKAIGPVVGDNQRYLGLAALAFAVQAIDGVPVPQPVNEAQIEAMVQRIGDAGIQAIADGLRPIVQERDLAAAAAGN
jgi:hypothetical protein